VLLEVVLISGGVFLGIAGEQWRENSAHRELARGALDRIRSEIINNQKAVRDKRDYHVRVAAEIKNYLAAKTPAEREAAHLEIHGVQIANFDRMAWDVAIATQSLAYMDADIVFALSEVYSRQAQHAQLSGYLIQSEFEQPPSEGQSFLPFLQKVDVYFDDANFYEAQLLKLYDDVLPKINLALAGR